MAAAILKAMSTMTGENTIIRTAKYACFAFYNWLQNCWDIVLKWDSLEEQNNPHSSPIPSIEGWGVSCFQQVARTAAQRCMEGVGEGKIYFSPFKLARRQRGPLGQSVSINFVADCRKIARGRKRKKIQRHHHSFSESHRAQLSTNQRVQNRFVIVKLEFDMKQLRVL